MQDARAACPDSDSTQLVSTTRAEDAMARATVDPALLGRLKRRFVSRLPVQQGRFGRRRELLRDR